ncbi:MAG: ribbon-helix-helix domain-containing protein [Candidatus Thiodiazotropha sp.]
MNTNINGTKTVRASISFSEDVYKQLEQIAQANKVSLAWVVRQAADKYIHDVGTEAFEIPAKNR